MQACAAGQIPGSWSVSLMQHLPASWAVFRLQNAQGTSGGLCGRVAVSCIHTQYLRVVSPARKYGSSIHACVLHLHKAEIALSASAEPADGQSAAEIWGFKLSTVPGVTLAAGECADRQAGG